MGGSQYRGQNGRLAVAADAIYCYTLLCIFLDRSMPVRGNGQVG